MGILLLVIGIVLFVGLIVAHEWGHFVAARRSGVEVEEFGIFFPPRIYKRKMRGGWTFSWGLVPLGGFVKLKGEYDSDTEPGSFGAASTWNKSKIMAAGVATNLLIALILFTVLAVIGMPQLVDNQYTVKRDTQLADREVIVGYVEPGSPAAKAGLKAEDQLNDIGLPGYSPVGVNSAEQLPRLTKQFAGKTAIIYYTRGGEQRTGQAKLRDKTQAGAGYLGISPAEFTLQRSTWSAPIVAMGFSAQVTALTFQGLGHALGGLGSLIAGLATGNHAARQHGQTAATAQVAGPVGIFVILKNGSLLGYQFMLMIVAVVSLTLAIMNILPIPALDGGRLWTLLVSRALIKRPLSARAEETIDAVGKLVLLGLIIAITTVDIHRFF